MSKTRGDSEMQYFSLILVVLTILMSGDYTLQLRFNALSHMQSFQERDRIALCFILKRYSTIAFNL